MWSLGNALMLVLPAVTWAASRLHPVCTSAQRAELTFAARRTGLPLLAAPPPRLERRAAATTQPPPQDSALVDELLRRKVTEWNAAYAMFWAVKGDSFEIVADYVTEERKATLRAKRGDDDTFCESMNRHATS